MSKLIIDRENAHEPTIIRNREVIIPNWSAFNINLSTSNQILSKVGYCETFPYHPTSLDAVFSAMQYFVSLFEQLGKEYSVMTANMAIYLITKIIQMQTPNPFLKLVMQVGTFHLHKIFKICLGQFLEG